LVVLQVDVAKGEDDAVPIVFRVTISTTCLHLHLHTLDAGVPLMEASIGSRPPLSHDGVEDVEKPEVVGLVEDEPGMVMGELDNGCPHAPLGGCPKESEAVGEDENEHGLTRHGSLQ